jgi:hypothetical protein
MTGSLQNRSAMWFDNVSKRSYRYMFGGLYTNHISNVVTQQKNCPQYFHAIRIAEDLTICVSDDFENGFKYSIPFNGFFSCQQGNPLASKENLTQDHI